MSIHSDNDNYTRIKERTDGVTNQSRPSENELRNLCDNADKIKDSPQRRKALAYIQGCAQFFDFHGVTKIAKEFIQIKSQDLKCREELKEIIRSTCSAWKRVMNNVNRK